MGEHQALTTAQWNITREAQDELAFNSHRNLAAAYDAGFFDDLLTPVPGAQPGLQPAGRHHPGEAGDAQAGLRPEPGRGGHHDGRQLHSADGRRLHGAARLARSGPTEHDLPKLATVVDGEAAAVDFVHGRGRAAHGAGFAVPRLLARNGLTLDDFDFFEIHEAFAGTVLSTLAPGRTRNSAARGSGSMAPSAPSTAPSSTSTAHRWQPGTRSPPRAGGSWPRSPRCCTPRAG